jgi:hypothetical protein
MRYYVQESCLVDNGYSWYHIYSMDMELWSWLWKQPSDLWSSIKNSPEFLIREDLYIWLKLRFSS